jgi:shikimate kinase
MKIVLIGYRCTGKTAVGKRIAERLGLPFYDTDELIQGQSGKTVREIVDEGGWDAFRAAEKAIVKQLPFLGDVVIAAGGGAVMDAENKEILRRTGICIWLIADERTIVERMQNDQASAAQRPPLSDDGLERETAEILEARRPIYQEVADCIVDTTGKGIDAVVDEVSAAVDRHDCASNPVRSPVT